MHNVSHNYHPGLSEPIPKSNYALTSSDDTRSTTHFLFHQIYLTDTTTSDITSSPSFKNVQPTSDTTKTRFLLHFHTPEKMSNSSISLTSNFLILQMLH